MSIPIFICNRNLLTWPKNAVEWFNKIPDLRPIIIDNDSTYQPLLEWYKNCPCEVKYHKTNGGPFVAWTGYVDETVKGNKQPLYAVTDPDLDFSNIPLDMFDKIKELYESFEFTVNKIGVSLEIEGLPENPYAQNAKQWEMQFWPKPITTRKDKDLCVPVRFAAIDTTFAVYCYGLGGKRSTNSNLRMDRPYTAKHLPWYEDLNGNNEEYNYYLSHVQGSWSCWGNKFKKYRGK